MEMYSTCTNCTISNNSELSYLNSLNAIGLNYSRENSFTLVASNKVWNPFVYPARITADLGLNIRWDNISNSNKRVQQGLPQQCSPGRPKLFTCRLFPHRLCIHVCWRGVKCVQRPGLDCVATPRPISSSSSADTYFGCHVNRNLLASILLHHTLLLYNITKSCFFFIVNECLL